MLRRFLMHTHTHMQHAAYRDPGDRSTKSDGQEQRGQRGAAVVCRKMTFPFPLGTSAKDGNEEGATRIPAKRAKGIGNFGPEGAQGASLDRGRIYTRRLVDANTHIAYFYRP